MLATALLLLAISSGTDGSPSWTPPTLTASQNAAGVHLQVDGRDGGPVEIWDGDRLFAVLPAGSDPAELTTNALSGSHELVARRGIDCSPPVVIGTDGAATVTGNVVVVIPPGSLSATRVGNPASDVNEITVTDTRAGDLGFSVAVSVNRAATVSRTWAAQMPGNALQASDVLLRERAVRVGPGDAVQVARYPAGMGTGSVRIGVQLSGGRPDHGTTRVVWTLL